MNEEFPILEKQQRIHELIATHAPLGQTLDAVAEWMTMFFPTARVSLMTYDPGSHTLSTLPGCGRESTPGPQFSDVPVETGVASFGTAAHLRSFVATEDITIDRRWENYRESALADENIRACWSYPVLAPDNELLGVLNLYYPTPQTAFPEAKSRIQQAAALLALALIRERETLNHRTLYEWHSALFNNHSDSVYELDLEGLFQRGNAALEITSGYSEAELVGVHYSKLIIPEDLEHTESAFNAACCGQTVTYETRGVHARGHILNLEVTNFPVVIDDKIVGVWGICRDITERKHQTDELRLLKRGIEASPNGLIMVDARKPDMPIVFANPAFSRITGYPSYEILGQNCRFLQGEDTDPEAVRQIREGLQQARRVDVALINYRKDGTPFWNRVTISPVLDATGMCTHFIGIQQDITYQKEQEAKIAYQATHDLLTGLPNRMAFSDSMAELFKSCQKNQKPLAFLYLDLDGFKSINDGLGYSIGNQLLVEVARRIQSSMETESVVGRLVGDEFGILLYGYQDSSQVIAVAEKILQKLVLPFDIGELTLHLSGSIGIAATASDLAQPHELMQYADLALTHAKRKGRNTWQWYRGGGVRTTRDAVVLRNELQKALENDQFVVHYQPLVDAVSGRIRSVEALVRWNHPERGMVSPGDFIPLAEETGQIIPLGQWVLRQACREIARLNADSDRILPVAVNISSLQFLRENFLTNVDKALEESGLPARFLELEVTESVLLDGAEPVIALMESLNKRGIHVAIDDFGTGFSSLSYLRDLPTHKVKLDRSFINKTLTDRRTAAIVQGVITMAHHMDMVVVAEGIETLEEQNDLVRRNCDLLQGYRFSKPVPLEVLAELPDRLPVG
jgi:diguanylate cyclase (GGDEF)-like protein/PAS domain S-box-containing protein